MRRNINTDIVLPVEKVCEQMWPCVVLVAERRESCLLELLFIVRKWKKGSGCQVHKQSWESKEARQVDIFLLEFSSSLKGQIDGLSVNMPTQNSFQPKIPQ